MSVRSRCRGLIAVAALTTAALTHAQAQGPAVADRIALAVDATKAGAKIDHNLFGQFAEHLGKGIYEGVWVGPGSPIPNTRGIRQRRRRGTQGAEGAERAVAGRLLRRRLPLA